MPRGRAKPAEPLAPGRLWTLSWGLWLLVVCAVLALVGRRLNHHGAEMDLVRRTREVRIDICEGMAREPRPDHRECLIRALDEDSNLLAPRSAG
jgi:hypothetical protein